MGRWSSNIKHHDHDLAFCNVLSTSPSFRTCDSIGVSFEAHIVVMVKSPAISPSVYKPCLLSFAPRQSYVSLRALDESRKQLHPLVLPSFPRRDAFHCVNIQYTRPERDGPVSRGQGRHAKYQKGGLSNLSPCAAATSLSLINTCERQSRKRCLPADAGSDTSRTLATRTSCQFFRDSRLLVLSSGDLKEGLEEGDTPL